MQANTRLGRNQVVEKIQSTLGLMTKKEAELLLKAVVTSLEEVLLENLNSDRFSIKLGSFGKFSIRHKSGTLRKIPFTGETKLTKDKRKVRFVSLGVLRERESMGDAREPAR